MIVHRTRRTTSCVSPNPDPMASPRIYQTTTSRARRMPHEMGLGLITTTTTYYYYYHYYYYYIYIYYYYYSYILLYTTSYD